MPAMSPQLREKLNKFVCGRCCFRSTSKCSYMAGWQAFPRPPSVYLIYRAWFSSRSSGVGVFSSLRVPVFLFVRFVVLSTVSV